MRILTNQVKKHTFKINGHEVEALLTISYDHDDVDLQYLDDAEQISVDLANEVLSCVYVQVSVLFEGLEGTDGLGQVFVKNASFERDILDTVVNHGMIQIATNELVEQVLDSAKKFNKFLTKAA